MAKALGRNCKDDIYPMKRRDFLKRIVKSFFFLIGLCFVPIFAYLYPFKIKERPVRFIQILEEDDLPQTGVKRVSFSYEQGQTKINRHLFVVRSDEGLTALSPACTHLGCLVNWNKSREEFICPCHGGRYDRHGKVIGGPPPAPLNRLPLDIRDGRVYVGLKV